MLQGEAPRCSADGCDRGYTDICRTDALRWRCRDCFGSPLLCQPCLLESHRDLPFHRVDVWDEESRYFRRSSLQQAGFVLYLGHGGDLCPHATTLRDPGQMISVNEWLYGPLPSRVSTDAERFFSASNANPEVAKNAENLDDIPMHEIDDEVGNVWEETSASWDTGATRMLLVGHTNGFHTHHVSFCRCPGELTADWQQLLRVRIWPATFGRPRSGFTLECLRDFRYINAVSKASANSYHSKLQRQTAQGVVIQCPVSPFISYNARIFIVASVSLS